MRVYLFCCWSSAIIIGVVLELLHQLLVSSDEVWIRSIRCIRSKLQPQEFLRQVFQGRRMLQEVLQGWGGTSWSQDLMRDRIPTIVHELHTHSDVLCPLDHEFTHPPRDGFPDIRNTLRDSTTDDQRTMQMLQSPDLLRGSSSFSI